MSLDTEAANARRHAGILALSLRHGGEAQLARNRYAGSGSTAQHALQAFLETLVLFPPDDTASNLNPGDPTAANDPQKGHGNIRLPALFLDPTDLE